MTDLKNQVYRSTAHIAVKAQQLRQDADVTPENKQILLDFIQASISRGNESTTQECHYTLFKRLGKLTKRPFNKFTKKDAEALMAALETSKRADTGEPIQQGTKNLMISGFKMLMKYLDVQPSVYDWIKKRKTPQKLQAESILTDEEKRLLVSRAPSLMHKALLSLLAETGCRPGEALQLTIGDVITNHDHIKCYAQGKTFKHTGKRPLFLFKSYQVMREWLEANPHKDDKNAPVFVRPDGRPLRLNNFSTWVQHFGKRILPKKKVNAYLFRHSFATDCVRKGFAPAVIQKLMGHSSLQMQEVYQHLSENDSEDALRRDAGLNNALPVKKEDADKCQRCLTLNGYGSLQCRNCHAALSAAGAIKVEEEQQACNSKMQRLAQLLETPAGLKIIEALEAQAEAAKKP